MTILTDTLADLEADLNLNWEGVQIGAHDVDARLAFLAGGRIPRTWIDFIATNAGRHDVLLGRRVYRRSGGARTRDDWSHVDQYVAPTGAVGPEGVAQLVDRLRLRDQLRAQRRGTGPAIVVDDIPDYRPADRVRADDLTDDQRVILAALEAGWDVDEADEADDVDPEHVAWLNGETSLSEPAPLPAPAVAPVVDRGVPTPRPTTSRPATDHLSAYLDRLVYGPKRTYAAAYAAHVTNGAPCPEDPGTDWARKARTRIDHYTGRK